MTERSDNVILGHTLGTPNMTVIEAIRLFRKVGLDGAEVIFRDDYESAIPEHSDINYWNDLNEELKKIGLPVVALTPYMHGYSSLEEEERVESERSLIRAMECAEALGAKHIRIYAGQSFYDDDADTRSRREQIFVETMKRCATSAFDRGISLNIENHFRTLCETATDTARIVKWVDSPAVNILYDQPNIDFVSGEPYQEAIEAQKGRISYVHVKDFVWVDDRRDFSASRVERVSLNERIVRSRVPGQGIMDWPGIIRCLLSAGFDGPFSLEAEIRWHPEDLPEPEETFLQGKLYLMHLLSGLKKVR